MRAEMVAAGLGLVAASRVLDEDKGALSAILNHKRAPSVYLTFRIQEVFDITAKDLLNKDPPEEFFRVGVPLLPDRKHAPRRPPGAPPPSDASREAAHPGKPKHHAGGRG